MSQLFQELKRRNVFRVAIAYIAVAWLLLQVADIVLDNIAEPEWVMQVLMVFLALGFPLVVFFAWAFEMTPEGIKREEDVDRSQSTTSQTGRKLNFVITGVLAAAVMFLLYDKFSAPDIEPAATVTDQSVAVLPFVALSSGTDDEYFADGLTEEILNSLAQLPELLVTARTSAFHFKGKDIPVPEIAETLGVAHIIEGSVRRDGDRLRVTAQLIRAEDGFHLWSDTYDRRAADAFAVQADIAEKIAGALNVVLDEQALERMSAVGLKNPEAFIALVKGRELYDAYHSSDGDIEILRRANEWFERALELAPDLSDAHVYHSDLFAHTLIDASSGEDVPEEELTQAIAAMRADLDAAIKAAPDRPRQLNATFVRGLLLGEWGATRSLVREIAAVKTCSDAAWLDMVTLGYGLERELLAVAERMVACDPLDYSSWLAAVRSRLWLGDFDEAVKSATRANELVDHELLSFYYVTVLIGVGDYERAQDVIDTEYRSERFKIRSRVRLAAAKGDATMTAQRLAEYSAADLPRDELRVGIQAVTNNRDEANRIAAEIDARPFGHLLLMQVPADCVCGAPFDLEYTPNFAQLLEDADLPWPPASPIEWPLKDW